MVGQFIHTTWSWPGACFCFGRQRVREKESLKGGTFAPQCGRVRLITLVLANGLGTGSLSASTTAGPYVPGH